MFFLMGHSSRYVDAGQKHKDKGLDGGGEDGDGHERQRQKEGDDRGDDQDQQLLSEDVAEQPDRERDRTGEMADDLYREEERGQKRGGAGEMLEIFKQSLGFYTLPVVVNEDRQGTAHGHVELAGRGHEPGHKAEKVAEEDKKPDGADHREVFSSLFSDDIDQKVLEERNDELKQALAFGGDDAELAGGQAEEEYEPDSHEQAHHDIVREEMLWMGDLDPDQRQKISNRFTEYFVKEFDQV